MTWKAARARALTLLALALLLAGCTSANQSSQSLVIYSGRSEELIAPFFEDFTSETGIKVEIRYGDSAALAAQLLEEKENSPADLFLSQDAGALGAVAGQQLLTSLSDQLLLEAPAEYISTNKDWVGITGRVRVLAYSPERVTRLPNSVDELIDPSWNGRLGIAPTNSSFQTFITAMIQSRGEAATESWLTALMKNSPKLYEKNSLIVAAIDAGEIDAGLVNHYYLWEVSEELGREVRASNHFFAPGDIGNLVNVSGAGILASSSKQELAEKFIKYLLSAPVQKKFVEDTHEFSLTRPELQPAGLPKLSAIGAPRIELSDLADLQSTQKLLLRVGAI